MSIIPWNVLDMEPPMSVTRIRSTDGRIVAIRGSQCSYEGDGYSHWAYLMVDDKPRQPGPDTGEEENGWVCWLELDFAGRCKMTDDTANDTRRS